MSRKPEPYGPPTTESLKGEAASPSCHIHLLFSTPQGTKASWHTTSVTKMARFVLVVILLVALIVDGSLSFMGWFGNSGKKPNGRRSVIKVSCRQNWTSFNLLLECKLQSDSELRARFHSCLMRELHDRNITKRRSLSIGILYEISVFTRFLTFGRI